MPLLSIIALKEGLITIDHIIKIRKERLFFVPDLLEISTISILRDKLLSIESIISLSLILRQRYRMNISAQNLLNQDGVNALRNGLTTERIIFNAQNEKPLISLEKGKDWCTIL